MPIKLMKLLKKLETGGGGAKINAWVDSMRTSSPTHKPSTSLSQTEDQLQHPSALGMFEQIRNASNGKQIVMFLDYDGTLSPIVEDPDRTFMTNQIMAARQPPLSLQQLNAWSLQQLNACCPVRTKDDYVFMVRASVQYRLLQREVSRIFMEPLRTEYIKKNVEAFVTNVVEARVRGLHLFDFFVHKNEIAETLKEELVKEGSPYGCEILGTVTLGIPPPWDQYRQPLGPSDSVSPPSTSRSKSESDLSRCVSTWPSSSGSKRPDEFNQKLKCPADTPNLKNAVMLYQPIDGDTPTQRWLRSDTSYEFVKNSGGGDERYWVLKVGSEIEARVSSDMPRELFEDTHRVCIGDCVLEFSNDGGYQNFVTVFQDCLSKNTDVPKAPDENNKGKDYGKEEVNDSKDGVGKSLAEMPSGISVESAITGFWRLLCGAKARIDTSRKKVFLLPVTRFDTGNSLLQGGRDCIATDDPSLQTRRSTEDWVELAKTLLTLSASACYASSSTFPRVANGLACVASMNAILLGHRSGAVTRILVKFGATSCAAGILYEMGKDLPEEYILVPIIVFLIIATIVALAE